MRRLRRVSKSCTAAASTVSRRTSAPRRWWSTSGRHMTGAPRRFVCVMDVSYRAPPDTHCESVVDACSEGRYDRSADVFPGQP